MKKIDKKKVLILIVIAVLLAAIFIFVSTGEDNKGTAGSSPNIGTVEESENLTLDAGSNLEVTGIGSYDGPYMEDGSDEDVKNVLMIQVTNRGENPVQYGEITLSGDADESALFKFSTLNPGQTVTVLEANKQEYNKDVEYTAAAAANVAMFYEELNTYAKKLEIQPLDGGLNVTNISDKDIEGEIVIYFKDCEGDMLMGGITYRGRIEGGLKAGEIRQIMSENFTAENTQVMFITIDGE